MPPRREFLAKLGVAAAATAAMAFDADELKAARSPAAQPPSGSAWDTSWLDRLASAQFKVVFNGSEVADGAAFDYVSEFLDQYHEVHGTTDAQTRAVVVARRNGIPIAMNDAMWAKYGIGEDIKANDPATHAPARRNIYWKAREGASPEATASTISVLRDRGMIMLVCNIALGNWATGLARKHGIDPEAGRTEWQQNLVPGAILVPSGIYALIRAQNAGCAWMPGT